jgi:succinylglutamate desuccinylase
MAVAHYGYLVIKILSPNSVIKIHGDRTTGVFALEKLQDLVTRTQLFLSCASVAQLQHPV